MDFRHVPEFVLAASQDIYELVLTKQLDLAVWPGRAAGALARSTFLARNETRPPLDNLSLSNSPVGMQAFFEILAFVFVWTDVVLQAGPFKTGWLHRRQERYRDVLEHVKKHAPCSESGTRRLDEIIATRAAEYGVNPRDAAIALSMHLSSLFHEDAVQFATCAAAYAAVTTVELFARLEQEPEK